MPDIRPVSDMTNKLDEIEKTVQNGIPVYLTDNGYGTMVVLSLESYSQIMDKMGYDASVETILDEAEERARRTDVRYTHEEMYERLRKSLYAE